MKCDSWALLLARTFASPYLGRKPKAKVMIDWANTIVDSVDILDKSSSNLYIPNFSFL
jgi:hypothetical protein